MGFFNSDGLGKILVDVMDDNYFSVSIYPQRDHEDQTPNIHIQVDNYRIPHQEDGYEKRMISHRFVEQADKEVLEDEIAEQIRIASNYLKEEQDDE